eukprot:CAMPEP_0182437860 /NCGR_PEP_ID=MMETSP1167-20130531/85330_1 /TAXON_ID=2988 /ORGANISM="Mallomonas Sp, Strain CCMP3275" /LENGTH=261 /DNA_ID=CAMNT_0024630923 /DNA_START=12 /DNA_END=794 /DNA_ORIENTATION=+
MDYDYTEEPENLNPDATIISRSTNHLKVGFIGLPNVGKSSLFSVLSQTEVPSDNFLFATIDPNIAICEFDDERFGWLCDVYKPRPEKKFPPRYTLIDTLALVRGANEGKGMSNEGLDAIRCVEVMCHVVRAFPDNDVTHVEGSVDAVRDVMIIERELIEKDKAIVSLRIAEIERNIGQNIGGVYLKFEFDTLVKVRDLLFGGNYNKLMEDKRNGVKKEKATKRSSQLTTEIMKNREKREKEREEKEEKKEYVPVPIRSAKW